MQQPGIAKVNEKLSPGAPEPQFDAKRLAPHRPVRDLAPLEIFVAQARLLCVKYVRLIWWNGVVAQLAERLVRNEKVRGSTPLGSTTSPARPGRGIPDLLVHLPCPPATIPH